jgi:hypothetical protein
MLGAPHVGGRGHEASVDEQLGILEEAAGHMWAPVLSALACEAEPCLHMRWVLRFVFFGERFGFALIL